jgi:hypothetical protein
VLESHLTLCRKNSADIRVIGGNHNVLVRNEETSIMVYGGESLRVSVCKAVLRRHD